MSEVAEMDSKAIDSFFSRIVGMIPLSLYRHTLSEEQNAADDMKEGNSKYFKVVACPCRCDESFPDPYPPLFPHLYSIGSFRSRQMNERC